VILVAAVASAEVQRIASELRRDSLVVDMVTADILRSPPSASVYVFCFDATHAVALAAPIVEWASKGEHHSALIGVISDGGGDEREALLAAGFDDAIAGRLSTRELSARVRAVHRRTRSDGDSRRRLRFGGFTLDVDNHVVWIDGISISLTAIELAVMRELIVARGKPLSRDELLAAAWGEDELEITERAVDNVILRLRRKLPRPDAIETVRSVGFRIAD
jgi:DNA-binding response OmpR family regulator